MWSVMSDSPTPPATGHPLGMVACQRCNLGPAATLIRNRGDFSSPLVIVGEAPGEEERERGEVFIGPSGQLLEWALVHTGLDSYKPWITNSVKCFPGRSVKPTKTQVTACCETFLHGELAAHPRQLILCLGGTASLALVGRADKVTEHMGVVAMSPQGYPCLFNVHPAAVLRDPGLMPGFLLVFERAKGLLDGTFTFAQQPTVTMCWDEAEAVQAVRQLAEEVNGDVPLAFDFETTSLDPHTCDIIGLALSASAERGVWLDGPMLKRSPVVEGALALVRTLFADETVAKVAHNAKFDTIIAERHIGPVRGPLHDTMIAAQLWDENLPLGLKEQGVLRLGLPRWDELTRGKRDYAAIYAENPQGLAQYAGTDACVTAALASTFQLPELATRPVYSIMSDALRTLADMECRGMLVDPTVLDRMAAVAEDVADEALGVLKSLVGHDDFNPGSTQQVGAALYTQFQFPVLKRSERTGAPSTDEESLKGLMAYAQTDPDREAFLRALITYRGVTKTVSTYIEGITKRLHEDGRLRCSYNVCGAATGRLSSSGPNMQNVPKVLRPIFIAPDGFVLGEFDFSQLEVRIGAALSHDEAMLQAIADADADYARYTAERVDYDAWCARVEERTWIDPRDVAATDTAVIQQIVMDTEEAWRTPPKPALDTHRLFAAIIFDKAPEDVTDEERTAAKTSVFGIMYGKDIFTLTQDFGGNEELATRVYNAFFNAFPGFAAWRKKIMAFATRHGYVENPYGRVRRLPAATLNFKASIFKRLVAEALRQAVNTPIQGSGGTLTVDRLNQVAARAQTEWWDVYPVATVHDSIVLEMRESDVAELAPQVAGMMAAPCPLLDVPLRADWTVGHHWGGEFNEAKYRAYLLGEKKLLG